MHLSVVVPVYGSPNVLIELVERCAKTIEALNIKHYEIVLVNDRCPKGSWEVIEEITSKFSQVIGINLSRNFGQHYAILAGLEHCKGEWTVVMDCDLQDVPEEIANLYRKTQEGYDLVFACRAKRNDSFFKKLGSSLFYSTLSYATGTKQDARIANFGIYQRKVIDAVLQFRENLRFFPVNVRWLGFKYAEMDVQHSRRNEGKSSYSLSKLFALGFNIIFSFSDKPMHLFIRAGILISTLSVLMAFYFIVRWFIQDITVAGWASIMVSLWFMFGFIIFSLGIVGIYVAKAFDEGKNRPLYIIDEVVTNRATEDAAG